MKSRTDALKFMALNAKRRLRGEPKFKVLSNNIKTISTKADCELLEKVKMILESEEDILNPIAMLMDTAEYKKLSANQKEKYFFDLVEKYHTMKAKIEREYIAN